MATAHLRFEPQRDLLSQAIVRSLKSWPETQRRIFVELHYGGRSVEDIARSLDMTALDVVRVLRQCERSLFKALKVFREAASREASPEPPHPISSAA